MEVVENEDQRMVRRNTFQCRCEAFEQLVAVGIRSVARTAVHRSRRRLAQEFGEFMGDVVIHVAKVTERL